MKILLADYILTMDKEKPLIRNGAVVFDQEIVAVVEDLSTLHRWEKDSEVIKAEKNSLLMPGLINAHTHLEFSANTTDLEYGSFIGWLNSVIKKREDLVGNCKKECHKNAIDLMIRSGTTAFGAVSSYGFDLEACVESSAKVVYFNELIGSNPAALDAIYADFVARFENASQFDSKKFKSSIAIHSPYSTHPVLAKKVLQIARNRKLVVSTHFMESRSERRWLDSGSGEFKPFFEQFLKTTAPVTTAHDFLSLFDGIDTLFVHSVHATDDELERFKRQNAHIVHSPVSNRLLGNGLLNLEKVKNLEIPYLLATDGLSSNRSLSLFDEMRSALLMHIGLDISLLARDMLRSTTVLAARALGINSGVIKEGKDADMVLFKLPNEVADQDLFLQTILHAPSQMEAVFIDGERIRWS